MRILGVRLTGAGLAAAGHAIVMAAQLFAAAPVSAQERAVPGSAGPGAIVSPAAVAAGAPALAADNPFQCWWRASSGAIRLGEVVDVTLTCAVLESDGVTAVADESRLTVAAMQLSPFEIVDGSHPPDVRADDRRFFQYRYRLRIINPDVIGRDVKLPPLAIPYKLQSRVGAATTLAGRDLLHLMPQLVFRVVSQVPADADDIRDASDASLGEVDRLRFRASAFGVAAMVLAALGAVAALSAFLPVAGLLRGRRSVTASPLPDRVVVRAASRRLGALLDTAHSSGWTAELLSDAHNAARVVAGVVSGTGTREVAMAPGAAAPEGRFVAGRRVSRRRFAVTAHATPALVTQALNALLDGASTTTRGRLERLREALTTLTRTQYAAADRRDGDTADIDEAVSTARDIGAELAREQLLSPRAWLGRPAAPVVTSPDF